MTTMTTMTRATQPFFVLDWLDDLMESTPEDALEIAEMLKTPSKAKARLARHEHSGLEERQGLFPRCISEEQVCQTPKFSNRKRGTPASTSTHSLPTSLGLTPTNLFPDERNPSPDLKKKQSIAKKRSLALANGWNAKGLTKAKIGKWKDALSCWDQALELRIWLAQSDPRKYSADLAHTWNNRGIALGKLGEVETALESLQNAYEIRISIFESDHPQVISTLHNIANVHQQAENYQLALSVFGKAKSLLVSKHDKDPMLAARICTAMGHLYYQAQQWIDSRDAYQDAMNILLHTETRSKNQQQELLELQRDIQELDAKLLVYSRTSSLVTSSKQHALY